MLRATSVFGKFRLLPREKLPNIDFQNMTISVLAVMAHVWDQEVLCWLVV